MASKQDTGGARSPQRRPQPGGKPLTIDLDPGEVRSAAAAGAPAAAEPPGAGELSSAGKTPASADPPAAGESTTPSGPTEAAPSPRESPPPADDPVPTAAAAGSGASGTAEDRRGLIEDPTAEEHGAPVGFGPALIGGAIGALLVLAILAILIVSGTLPLARQDDLAPLRDEIAVLRRDLTAVRDGVATRLEAFNPPDTQAVSDAIAALARRVDALEAQLGDISGRLDAGAAERGDLANRMARLEQDAGAAPAAADGGLAERLAALEARVNDLAQGAEAPAGQGAPAEALAVLQNRFGDLAMRLGELQGNLEQIRGAAQAASDQSGGLAQRLGALDERLTALGNRLDSVERTIGTPTAQEKAALALAAAALQGAVARGEPFASELASFETVAGSSEAVEALKPYAENGVPPPQALAATFDAVSATIIRAAGTAQDEGVVGRLMANARSLVTVRPRGYAEGGGVEAAVSRIDALLARGDLVRALEEWNALPEVARAAAPDFGRDLNARVTADRLVREATRAALDAAIGQR